ncbi:MAG: hypothetical protein ACJ72W_08115 [Actinoallomurus sp.]
MLLHILGTAAGGGVPQWNCACPGCRRPPPPRACPARKLGFVAVAWCFAAGHRRGWDHLEVLLSLVYRLVRCLLGLLAVLVRSDLSKDVELLVLRQENQVLRRQRPPPRRALMTAQARAGGPRSRRGGLPPGQASASGS